MSGPISEEEEFEFRLRAEREAESALKAKSEVSGKTEKSQPTFGSESAKIAGQFASGLALDIPNIGNKPISELIGGTPLSYAELGKKIMEDWRGLPDRVKSFALAGASSLKFPEQATLHSEFGFPVPPQPETGIGKILGVGANLVGQALVGNKIQKSLTRPASYNLKYPSSSQIEKAIKQMDENVGKMHTENENILSTERARTETSKLFRNIKNNEDISSLEVQRRTVADQQAIRVQKELGGRASKKLGEAFFEEYSEAGKDQYVTHDNYREGLESVLQKSGVVDEAGELIDGGVDPNSPTGKILKLYQDAKNKYSNDVYSLNSDGKMIKPSMPLLELDKNLKSVLIQGKQYGSADRVMTDLRYEFSQKVAPLRKIGKKYASDFQLRNSVFDNFNIYNRMGFRRGTGNERTGIGVLENISHENPASVYPQNKRMMEFLRKYAGEDPSEPLKNIRARITSIKTGAENEDLQSKFRFDEMESRIKTSEAVALQRAEQVKADMLKLMDRAKLKEATGMRNKIIGTTVAYAAAGSIVAPKLKSGLGRVLSTFRS